jgi:hypothetical protein
LILIAFGAPALKLMRPNRLRLTAQGFEFVTTWRARRRFRWAEVEPLGLLTFGSRRGRQQVVAYMRKDGRGGWRDVKPLPADLSIEAPALLRIMNDLRNQAVAVADEAG